jgi:cytochrome c551
VHNHRLLRLVGVPLLLFVTFAGAAFALAKLHLAKPGTSAVSGPVYLGDARRGAAIFSQTCASCHGQNGTGGIGPRLAGATITLPAAKAQIDHGGGSMPAALVTGQQEQDVLAYLGSIFAKS